MTIESTSTSWSYSKLLDFEQCKLRYKLKHIDRVPEEKSPAADRGTAIHGMAEDFILGNTKSLPTELLKFSDDFSALRNRYSNGLVSVEGEWGFDKDWQPTVYKTAWLRMKADAVAFNKERTEAIVIDFKTGRKFGNEIKHGNQVQLYALASAILNPTVQKFILELWYLDKDELTTNTYTRKQAMSFVKQFDKRAKKIDAAHKSSVFEPNPNQVSCQWCAYGPQKGNQCPHGYTGSMTIADYRRKYA